MNKQMEEDSEHFTRVSMLGEFFFLPKLKYDTIDSPGTENFLR